MTSDLELVRLVVEILGAVSLVGGVLWKLLRAVTAVHIELKEMRNEVGGINKRLDVLNSRTSKVEVKAASVEGRLAAYERMVGINDA